MDQRLLVALKEKLYLLGWDIFVLNIPQEIWTTKTVAEVYRLRWRIEIIFKAWKSHLGITTLNTRSETLLRLSVAMKLLFCAIAHSTAVSIEMLSPAHKHVSLLRTSRILKEFSILFTALLLNLPLMKLLSNLLCSHAFYDQRPDRTNFIDQLKSLGVY